MYDGSNVAMKEEEKGEEGRKRFPEKRESEGECMSFIALLFARASGTMLACLS